jgi:hypothetical protein
MNYSPEVVQSIGEWVNKQTVMLEKEIIEAKAKEVAEEIDREVLWGMLKELGWRRVMLSSETAMIYATAIKEWLETNCIGSHEKHRSDFIFERAEDATLFILKWGG